MVLLILAVVWIAVLGPTIWRKLSGGNAGTSIDSFHHELYRLKHSGPKLVTPAFRLQTATASGSSESGFPTVSSMPGRPSLVLLEPNAQLDLPAEPPTSYGEWNTSTMSASDVGSNDRAYYSVRQHDSDRTRYSGRSEGSAPSYASDSMLPVSVSRRRDSRARRSPGPGSPQARRRRRNLVGTLLALLFVSALIGLASHLVWVLTVLVALVLGAYLALVLYARSLRRNVMGRDQVRSSGLHRLRNLRVVLHAKRAGSPYGRGTSRYGAPDQDWSGWPETDPADDGWGGPGWRDPSWLHGRADSSLEDAYFDDEDWDFPEAIGR